MHCSEPVKLSDCIDDMYAYTNLTDHVFHQILLSRDPKFKEASILICSLLVVYINILI